MNRNLTYSDYSEIDEYCNKKCRSLLINSENNLKQKDYYRGKYKSFLYLKKLAHSLAAKKGPVKQYELYNILKEQKSKATYTFNEKKDFMKGLAAALYEAMNFVNALK